IFLLNILSRLTLAKALEREDLLIQAETDWKTWFTETDMGGLTEYNSPTYIVTALAPLARMLPLCRNEKMQSQIETALGSLYADFSWHYHPALHLLAGATSRSYSGDWLNNSLSNLIAYQQFNAPYEATNLVGPFVALSDYEAPEECIQRATESKSGITIRASIPDNHIQRITHFGEKYALGVKSGPSYGPQELALTLAYPGEHQRMVTLSHKPETRAPVYSEMLNGRLLAGIIYRDPPEIEGSPHNWSRIIFGPPDHFKTITVNGREWDGDYCAITHDTTVTFQTLDICSSFRFGLFGLSDDEPQVTSYLWYQYENNLVALELVTWSPSIVAIGVCVSEDGPADLPDPIVFGNGRLSAGGITVVVPDSDDLPLPDTLPLLDTPTVKWHRGDWASSG
ncbi:MAG: hypothetical protein QGG64_23345, partial [Candidatus Latescibacteria bacterium]|nr:hypothetical protein [Candidatus Latescibacterota bacterium]